MSQTLTETFFLLVYNVQLRFIVFVILLMLHFIPVSSGRNPFRPKETNFIQRKRISLRGNAFRPEETHFAPRKPILPRGNAFRPEETHFTQRKPISPRGNTCTMTICLEESERLKYNKLQTVARPQIWCITQLNTPQFSWVCCVVMRHKSG